MKTETDKLELKHLAAYLMYKVKIQYNNFKYPLDVLEIGNIEFYFKTQLGNLILHPFYDLLKEIEVNGKTIIPIEELAKIEVGSDNIEFIDRGFDEETDSYWIVYNDEFGENTLIIDLNSKSFFHCMRSCYSDSPRNQYQLFQKLFELHFDVFGLIEKGLAIDINTIK